MDIKFFIIGVLSSVAGVFLVTRHKFYKYKTSDMLFVTKLRVFLGAAILVLYGVLIILMNV
jgi:hypothetical protein